MIRNTANVSFYCRESKKNKDGMAPIELSLVINGKRCYVQLPRKEDPAQFKRALNCKKDNDLKDYLRSIRVRLNEIETAGDNGHPRHGQQRDKDNDESFFHGEAVFAKIMIGGIVS